MAGPQDNGLLPSTSEVIKKAADDVRTMKDGDQIAQRLQTGLDALTGAFNEDITKMVSMTAGDPRDRPQTLAESAENAFQEAKKKGVPDGVAAVDAVLFNPIMSMLNQEVYRKATDAVVAVNESPFCEAHRQAENTDRSEALSQHITGPSVSLGGNKLPIVMACDVPTEALKAYAHETDVLSGPISTPTPTAPAPGVPAAPSGLRIVR